MYFVLYLSNIFSSLLIYSSPFAEYNFIRDEDQLDLRIVLKLLYYFIRHLS